MVIPVTLTNLGGYDLTKGAKILLKVINNGQYSTRSTTDIAELKSLQSITVNVPYVPLAGDITNSKVTIKVEAEVDGIDVDTSDNSITRELSTMQGVEIKLDLGTVGKATVDTAYEIPFAVTNIGNVATTKPIQIKYDLFDEATKTYKPHGQTLTIINLLAPGTSASIKLQFPAKSMAKVYSLWAVLYSDEDFSKSNNEQVFELEVIPVAPQGQGTQPPGGSSSGSSSSGSGRRGGSGGGVIVPKVIPKPIPDTKAGGKVNIKVTEDSVVSSLGLTFKGNQPAGFINFISLDDVPVGIPAPPYDVYAYFEIRHDSILNVNLDEVELLFKVEEEWLAAREASKDDIILLRYNNDWELMPVIYLNSDVRYHNYQADLPGLSVFAIAKKNAGFDEAPEEEEKPKKPINWVAVIIIILVLLIVGGALIFLAIRNKPQTGKPDLQSTVQKLKGQGYSESQIRGMMYKKGADMQKLEEILKKIK
ncbi:PGF-pre-PGF domain-containing protein [Candidatus Woesearchaeota archaeon]|nr:PGF-pre-PGF domain-containing protein [Candidatus Woesearchaeota archaeon]